LQNGFLIWNHWTLLTMGNCNGKKNDNDEETT